jgi:glycosyltransferase involved in cell wall biosynthesis
MTKLRVLFISNLFPNAVEPTRGIFNALQVAALAKICRVEVVAPTPTRLPDETRDGVRVSHPRFFHVPVLSRPLNGWLFARAVEPFVARSGFDIAFASWAYPDAYGVMLLAKKYKFPFAADVLGSDVNIYFRNPRRKKQILRALRASRTVFAKSKALAEILAAEGVESIIDYNGVDRERFRPLNRVEVCRKLDLDPNRRRVLYVGNFVPVKGATVLARAAEQLGDTDVIFVGDGSETITAGYCVGARPHEEIPLWMNACDILCLPSLSEGMPNVILEAMACGLPVVASRVGGVLEIVREGLNGFTVPPSDPNALAEALRRALAIKWDHDAIRVSVANFDWDENARMVFAALNSALANS